MKVKELLLELQEFHPDTQLIVAYWDKECFKALDTEARLLTDKEWNDVAGSFKVQNSDQSMGRDIREALERQQEVNDEWAEQLMNDILAKQKEDYEEQYLWDSPATKITGEPNDNT